MANPNTAVFPYAAPTDVTLAVASDNAQTALSNDILSTDLSIDVDDASRFATPCLVVIDAEIIRVKATSGNTLTQCDRGFAGTTPSAHSQGEDVFGYVLSYHHNQLSAELQSLAGFVFESDLSGFKTNENLVAHSELFSDSSWSKQSGVTAVVNGTLLPNGSPSFTLKEGSSLGPNMISAVPAALTPATNYTFSVYAKYTNNAWIAVGQHIEGSEGNVAWFNIQNGVVGTIGSAAQAAIVPVGNGWFRCLVVAPCTADSYQSLDIALTSGDGTLDYLGTATKTVLIAGAQVRTGVLKGPLSYIKTTASPFSHTDSGDLILDEGDLTSAGVAVQHRRGTTGQHASFTGKIGEVTIDTTKKTIVIHDESTAGGFPLALEGHTHGAATDSVPGFMSASDKTKLDSIPGGAINYQTVQANGVGQTTRGILNLSANFTVTDDSAGNRSSVDLSDIVAQGTYTKLTVSAKGRVTAAAQLAASDVPTITSTKISDFTTAARAISLDLFTSAAADVNLNSNKIINLAEPISGTDAATKQYVDTTATGLTFKAACRAASTGSVNISAPGTSVDTVSLSSGDRVLLKNQTAASQNGIYVFNGASTPMTRALDANSSSEVKAGMFILVTEGSTNANVGFVLSTTGTITLDTTALSFVTFSAGTSVSAGNGIAVSGNTVSVQSASSTRISVGSGGIDLAAIGGLTPGTYNQVVVDAYGRITSGSSQTYQPQTTNLTAVSALSATGIAVRTGSGTFAARTIQQGTGISVVNGDGVSGNIQISQVDDSATQRIRVSKNGTLSGTRQEINFIEGSNITITQADNSGSNRLDVTITAGATDGAGAPATSQYVVLATDAALTNERSLVVGTGLSIVDGGAGNNVILSFVTDFGTL